VPAGTYDISVTPPAGYAAGDVSDTGIVVPTGGAVSVTNDLVQAPLTGTGRLTKEMDLSGLPATANFQAEILFCEGFVAVADCDTKAESVVYGSVDDFINVVGPSWQLSALVPAGPYTICSAAAVTIGTETVSYPFQCEHRGPHFLDGVAVTGGFYVFDGSETLVVNDVAALVVGSLEVYVENAGVPLTNIEITLKDADGNIVGTQVTGATGLVTFNVVAGTYTASAIDINGTAGGNFEDQEASVNYSIASDVAAGFNGIVDAAATADLQMTLTAIP
jgi:hypothetical protein